MSNVIFVDENIPLLADSLKHCGEVTKFTGRNLTCKDLIDSGCSALIVRSTTKINSGLLIGTNIKFVATATSGIDHVDVEFLKNNNINFAYAPGSNANSVAEYVLFAILKWNYLTNIELPGITIGIVGFGNIGKIIAKYSVRMGLNILVNDPPLKDEGFIFPDYIKYAELDEICWGSDIITNHVPLTYGGSYPTYKLFQNNLNFIKPSSLFIHTSRGGVVDEKVLLSILTQNLIYIAIDVWENEPNINTRLLEKAIIATPHIAGYSRDGKIRGVKMMADAFKNHSGLEPDYKEINKELSLYKPMNKDTFREYGLLYNILNKSRDFDKDTKNLKEILKNKSDADIFDKLRKTYPSRREVL